MPHFPTGYGAMECLDLEHGPPSEWTVVMKLHYTVDKEEVVKRPINLVQSSLASIHPR